jgi:glyoxylase-like metal-dependent hydrolase (beta-lactamase superfamily II)
VLAADDALPGGAVAFAAPTADEVVFWLPAPRSLVPGDVLLGTDAGLELCPGSWLGSRGGLPRLVDDLAPLLELPVERVLTSHGPPVLSGGRDALAYALASGGGAQPSA